MNRALQLPIMSLMHRLLNSIEEDMMSEIGSFRGRLRPHPLRFHVDIAGAHPKLSQHGPLGVTYHRWHPISTIPVAKVTAYGTVLGTWVQKEFFVQYQYYFQKNYFKLILC